ncbi:MAG: hypothetical protein JSV25_03235 [Spirochaetota bacterium]|nr:MAG: hypothetical protein JSV25_03235 [Spirochaetota bacterium]
MVRKYILTMVIAVADSIDSAIHMFIFLRDRAQYIWKDIAIRKWIYGYFNLINRLFVWLKRYLDGVGLNMKYRIYYKSVTEPLKVYYRELRRDTFRLNL